MKQLPPKAPDSVHWCGLKMAVLFHMNVHLIQKLYSNATGFHWTHNRITLYYEYRRPMAVIVVKSQQTNESKQPLGHKALPGSCLPKFILNCTRRNIYTYIQGPRV